MKHTLELYKQNRYEIISKDMIKVDNETVKRQVKKGREILICSCENSSRFGHSQICRHKRLFLYLPILTKLENKLNNLILEYKAGKTILNTEEGKTITNQIINDIENLKL